MLHGECTKAKRQMPVLLSDSQIQVFVSQHCSGMGITTQRNRMMDASLTDKAEFFNSSSPSANFSEVVQGVTSDATLPTLATPVHVFESHSHDSCGCP